MTMTTGTILAVVLLIACLGTLVGFRQLYAPHVLNASGNTMATMQVVLSLVFVAASLYIILSGGYADTAEKFAYTTVGTILGYWLSPKPAP